MSNVIMPTGKLPPLEPTHTYRGVKVIVYPNVLTLYGFFVMCYYEGEMIGTILHVPPSSPHLVKL